MEAEATVNARALEGVARTQSNALYDVIALLSAAEDRIDAASTARADDQMHSTLRLVQMARKKVDATIDALDPYI